MRLSMPLQLKWLSKVLIWESKFLFSVQWMERSTSCGAKRLKKRMNPLMTKRTFSHAMIVVIIQFVNPIQVARDVVHNLSMKMNL
jgi:hypothetical protein